MPAIPFSPLLDTTTQLLDARAPTPDPIPIPAAHFSPEDLTLRLLLTARAPVDSNGLVARQSSNIVPEGTYAGINAGPAPGTVVGIVLGSVAGFLLLIWLLWTLSNGTTFIRTSGELEEVSEVRVRRDSSRRTKSRRAEMASRSGSPARRVYRSERIVRDYPPDRSRSPSVARSRAASRIRERETIIVDERVPGDDIIEVLEEHSSIDAPRRKNRRSDRSRY